METDVCLVLEGSYPYVRGGVSEWVQELVGGLPDVSFSLTHLRGEDDPVRPRVYERPANLVELRMLDTDPERDDFGSELVDQLPQARVYHALSTGSAGLTGAETAQARGRPFLVTEHGLAWRAPYVAGSKPHRFPEPLAAREQWVERAEASARRVWEQAAVVATVCASNARLQAGNGAPARRLRVIQNATATARTHSSRAGSIEAPRVGFVGRVVAIKDVKTFLRACRLVADELPEAEFVVVGPLDHEPDYAEACLELAASLGLAEKIRFTGETETEPWYRRLDVVALTSLSEAQPLVLLEAMAAGVPVVATAVGGCPELVADSGLLTPVRSPRATATAILRLCADSTLRRRLVRAGLDRVRRRHARTAMLASYRELYERLAA